MNRPPTGAHRPCHAAALYGHSGVVLSSPSPGPFPAREEGLGEGLTFHYRVAKR